MEGVKEEIKKALGRARNKVLMDWLSKEFDEKRISFDEAIKIGEKLGLIE